MITNSSAEGEGCSWRGAQGCKFIDNNLFIREYTHTYTFIHTYAHTHI